MFLVVKLGRTGSTMFGDVLNAHPDIVCQNEILNHLNGAQTHDKIAYLSEYFYGSLHHVKAGPRRIIGGTINPFKYKLNASHILEGIYPSTRTGVRSAVARLLFARTPWIVAREPKINVILLFRKNSLKQAVSLYLAQDRQKWESSLDEIADRRVIRKRVFDLARLERLTLNIEENTRRLTALAESLSGDHLPVVYEDLVADPERVYGKVFSHIHASPVDPTFDLTGGYKKILPDDLRETIDNYDQLEDRAVLRKYL